jgi:hypothetical protein
MSRSDRLAMLTFVVLFGGTFIWFLVAATNPGH